jgi:hypothetical protein
MKWKNLPYWLRGGIISLGVIIIISILLSLIPIIIYKGSCEISFITYSKNLSNCFILSYFLLGLGALPFSLFFSPLFRLIHNLQVNLIFTILFGLITYFIIGAIIGLIVGKIKKKKGAIKR